MKSFRNWKPFTKARPDPLGGANPGADQAGGAVADAGKGEEPDGLPIFLMVGSLSGASRKDAEAYARGLADKLLTSVELGRIHVYDDRDHGRIIYEIHEGGPQFSIAAKVAEALANGEQVRIALADGKHLAIEQTHDQLFSLVHHDDEESDLREPGDVRQITEFVSDTKLSAIYPDRNGLAALGGVLLGTSLVAFLVAGALNVIIKSGATEPDALFAFASKGVVADASDNPAWQLERARQAAEKEGKTIRVLRKDARGWNWEFQP